MTLHSGKGGTATIANGTNTVELPVTGWNVDPTTEIQRFRNSKTGNYSVKENTFKDCTFSIRTDLDFDGSIFLTAGLNIQPGDLLTNVKLFLNGGSSGTGFWLFSSAIVVGTPQSLEVDGRIETTINGEASGSWTKPVI